MADLAEMAEAAVSEAEIVSVAGAVVDEVATEGVVDMAVVDEKI